MVSKLVNLVYYNKQFTPNLFTKKKYDFKSIIIYVHNKIDDSNYNIIAPSVINKTTWENVHISHCIMER